MFESIKKINWELLHQQKRVLLELLDSMPQDTPTAVALWGLVHLLDALQDDADAAGVWRFPEEAGDTPLALSPSAKPYYVEDDEGHHHGPLDDYDEAVDVADAVHGRIIVQAVDGLSADALDDEAGDA